MSTRSFSTVARLLAVLVLLAVAVLLESASSLSAGLATDDCVLKKIGETQYISCWNGRELESRQVPEYLIGAGVLIARRTGEVVWVPQKTGEAVSVRQSDDDELIVRVTRPVRLFFFNIRLSHEVRLSLDIAGNVE